jgi:hypothetical protein
MRLDIMVEEHSECEDTEIYIPRDSIQLNLFRYFRQKILEDVAK